MDIQAAKARIQKEFISVADKLVLLFRSGQNSIFGGLPEPTSTFHHGLTVNITFLVPSLELGVICQPQVAIPSFLSCKNCIANSLKFRCSPAFILVAFENVEPLMSMNLTSAERAVENLRFATILLHETAVCDF